MGSHIPLVKLVSLMYAFYTKDNIPKLNKWRDEILKKGRTLEY